MTLPLRRTVLGGALLSGLALGASTGLAKPRSPGAQQGPAGTGAGCPKTPTRADCLREHFLDKCGKQHGEFCKPIVEKALGKQYEASGARTAKMLTPKGTDIPADLRNGKVHPYRPPKGRKAVTKIGTGVFARSKLTSPPGAKVSAANAAKHHRNPAWDANGQTVGSCEEYGYEMLYDWMRFADASAACKGHADCIVDVAFLKSTPGIANRTLERRDGKALDPQIRPRKSVFPKNEMFALGSRFVYAGGPDGLVQRKNLEDLEKAMTEGETFYKLVKKSGRGGAPTKTGVPPRVFENEWDMHGTLRAANKKVSSAERQEYERRRAKFRHLIGQWWAAVAEEMKVGDVPIAGQKWELPFDMVTPDPYDRMLHMGKIAARQNKYATQQLKRLSRGKAAALQSRGGGPVAQPVTRAERHGRREQAPTTAVFGSLGPRTKPSSTKTQTKKSTKRGVKIDECAASHWAGVPVSETLLRGPLSCRVGRFLRREWERKAKGQKSCLDLGSSDCDWAPEMFVDRFVKGAPYISQQIGHEQWCKGTLKTNAFTVDPLPKDLISAEKYIIAKSKATIAAKTKLKPYEQPDGSYAWSSGDAEQWGDKDWFGAGYGYDLGWKVAPTKLGPTGPCSLGGEAWSGYDARVWLIGNKITVADASARGRLAKGLRSTKGSAKGHLVLLGESLFNVDQATSVVFAPDHAKAGSKTTPKPSWTFWAGPVPVTGSAWGELFWGATYGSNGGAQDSCSKPQFELSADFGPEAGINGLAQVGVGISGVLSAGVRGLVNLVTVGLPLHTSLKTSTMNIAGGAEPSLDFETSIKMTFASLSGWVGVYLEFLFFEEEWEIFRWNGIGPVVVDLGTLAKTQLPLSAMGTAK